MASAIQIEPRTRDNAVMTIEQLQATPEFNGLSSKQRMYLIARIQSNHELAVRLVYGGEEAYVPMLGNKVRNNPNVKRVLAMFYGQVYDEREEFIKGLMARVLHGGLTIADTKAAAMVMQMRGWGKLPTELAMTEDEQPKAAKAVHVGDIVISDGVRTRATKVNGDGLPIAGEPLE